MSLWLSIFLKVFSGFRTLPPTLFTASSRWLEWEGEALLKKPWELSTSFATQTTFRKCVHAQYFEWNFTDFSLLVPAHPVDPK